MASVVHPPSVPDESKFVPEHGQTEVGLVVFGPPVATRLNDRWVDDTPPTDAPAVDQPVRDDDVVNRAVEVAGLLGVMARWAGGYLRFRWVWSCVCQASSEPDLPMPAVSRAE